MRYAFFFNDFNALDDKTIEMVERDGVWVDKRSLELKIRGERRNSRNLKSKFAPAYDGGEVREVKNDLTWADLMDCSSELHM